MTVRVPVHGFSPTLQARQHALLRLSIAVNQPLTFRCGISAQPTGYLRLPSLLSHPTPGLATLRTRFYSFRYRFAALPGWQGRRRAFAEAPMPDRSSPTVRYRPAPVPFFRDRAHQSIPQPSAVTVRVPARGFSPTLQARQHAPLPPSIPPNKQ